MIILNLLPPEKKKDLATEVSFSQVRKGLVILLFSCVFCICLTVAVRVLLIQELQSIENDIENLTESLATQGNETVEEIIKKINNKGLQLTKTQESYIEWSDTLYQLGQTPNSNIQIKSIQINRDDETFDIQGFAKNRDDLLDFKELLERLNFLENINSPISNLIKKEDITFQLTGNFKNNKATNDEDSES